MNLLLKLININTYKYFAITYNIVIYKVVIATEVRAANTRPRSDVSNCKTQTTNLR